MIEFRCVQCRRLLGKVDEEGCLHVESTRFPEKIVIEKGYVVCRNNIEHEMCKERRYKFERIIQDKTSPEGHASIKADITS